MGIIKFENKEILQSLEGVRRQYLVGNLQFPQKLQHFVSKEVEIGISAYKEHSKELPHFHHRTTEYQYVINGWTKYIDTNTLEEYEFKKGDFYIIEKGTSYAQKCKASTEILFIKVPSINDKMSVATNTHITEWLNCQLKTQRQDYYHQENMPLANSMKPAASVAILHEDKILLLQRKDNDKWTLPGGVMEMNENLVDCAIREVQEECGIEVVISDILGTYTDPNIRIAYSDGEVRREFTIVYIGKVTETNITLDEESSNYQWIYLADALTLPMANSQRERLLDLQKYIASKQRVFK